MSETVKKYQVNNSLQMHVEVNKNNSNWLKMQTSARKMGFHRKNF